MLKIKIVFLNILIHYYTRGALLSDLNFQIINISIKDKFIDVLNQSENSNKGL